MVSLRINVRVYKSTKRYCTHFPLRFRNVPGASLRSRCGALLLGWVSDDVVVVRSPRPGADRRGMPKSKSPSRGRASKSPRGPDPLPPSWSDPALLSLTVIAADGTAEPLVQQVQPEFPLVTRIRYALPPGSKCVSVRAVARSRRSTVRIYRWNASASQSLCKMVELLHLTACRPLPTPSKPALIRIQSVVRGWIVRTRYRQRSVSAEGKLQMPPLPISVHNQFQEAALVGRAAIERWQRAKQQLATSAESSALEAKLNSKKGKGGKKGKKDGGEKSGSADPDAATAQDPRAIVLSEHEIGLRQAMSTVNPVLLSFLRASFVDLDAYCRKYLETQSASGSTSPRGSPPESPRGIGGSADAEGDAVLVDQTVFETALLELGLSRAASTPAHFAALYKAMGLRPAIRDGPRRKVNLGYLASFLLPAESELHFEVFTRLSLYSTSPEASVNDANAGQPDNAKAGSNKPPKKDKGGKAPKEDKGGKSPKKGKGGKGGDTKPDESEGGDSGNQYAALAAANDANEQALMKHFHPEAVAVIRIVVVAEDLTTRTYLLHVHIAPPLSVPKPPEAIRPVLGYIIRYYGEMVTTSIVHAAMAHSIFNIGSRNAREKAQATSVAAGTTQLGEHALALERFMSCCSQLGIATTEIARAAFLQVSRQRPGALLGASATWVAIFFAFVRSLSRTPLLTRCSHRWTYDHEVVLELVVMKLTHLQYNLNAAASLGNRCMRGESIVLQQLSSPVRLPQEADHYLVTGTLAAGHALDEVNVEADAKNTAKSSWNRARHAAFANHLQRMRSLALRIIADGRTQSRRLVQNVNHGRSLATKLWFLPSDDEPGHDYDVDGLYDEDEEENVVIDARRPHVTNAAAKNQRDTPKEHAASVPELYARKEPFHLQFPLEQTASTAGIIQRAKVPEIPLEYKKHSSRQRVTRDALDGMLTELRMTEMMRIKAGAGSSGRNQAPTHRVAPSRPLQQAAAPGVKAADSTAPHSQLLMEKTWAWQTFPESAASPKQRSRRTLQQPPHLPARPEISVAHFRDIESYSPHELSRESDDTRAYLDHLTSVWLEPQPGEEADLVRREKLRRSGARPGGYGLPSSNAMLAQKQQKLTLARRWYAIPSRPPPYGFFEVQVTPFSLRKSIWAPRERWCDAKDFYDNEEVLFKRFSNEWRRVLRHNVMRTIFRFDGDAATNHDAEGIPEEYEEVGAILLIHHQLINLAFSYYCKAALSSEDDVDLVALDGWTRFANDSKLFVNDSEHCKRVDIDLIFSEAVAMGEARQHTSENALKSETATTIEKKDEKNRQSGLTRIEFMCAIVRVALSRYLLSGVTTNMSVALEQLLVSDVSPTLQPSLSAPDEFRRGHCYTQEVHDVLTKHEMSLRVIFDGLDALTNTRGQLGKLCSFEVWRGFLRSLGLIGENSGPSKSVSAYCFLWSIMCVIDGQTVGGRLKEKHLPFEGFLEALCRFAAIAPLPTDDEIRDAELPDAGVFVAHLKREKPAMFEVFQTERTGKWNSPPRQPIHRCLEHLLQIIFRRIEGSDETPSEGATRTTNVRISGIEFFTWAKDNSMPGAMHELQTKQK